MLPFSVAEQMEQTLVTPPSGGPRPWRRQEAWARGSLTGPAKTTLQFISAPFRVPGIEVWGENCAFISTREHSVAKLQEDIEDSVDTWKAQQREKKQDPNCCVGIDCDCIIPVWTSWRLESGGMQYKCKSSFPVPAAPFPSR